MESKMEVAKLNAFILSLKKSDNHQTKVPFTKEITKGRCHWIWDAESGELYWLNLKDDTFDLELGPTESRIIKTAQKFTVLKNHNQPVQSIGLIGPVTLY